MLILSVVCSGLVILVVKKKIKALPEETHRGNLMTERQQL